MRRLLLVVAALAALVCAGYARAAQTLVVDRDHLQCPDAQFVSIQQAVQAAAPGDTVVVCPDLYDESVTVDKPVQILGQSALGSPGLLGTCSRLERPDPTRQAIVEDASDVFDVTASGVVLDGLVIQSSRAGAGAGIRTGFGSGYAFRNDIFQNLVQAIVLRTDGAAPSEIRDNCFRSNPLTGAVRGFGIDVRLASNVVIRTNAFFQNFVDVSLLGGVRSDATRTISGVSVRTNDSLGDEQFAIVRGTSGSDVRDNDVSGARGSAISVQGGNDGLVLTGNTLDRSGAGIEIGNGFAPDTTVSVTANTIREMAGSGIVVAPGSLLSSTIDSNVVRRNGGDGIHVGGGANAGNLIRANVSLGNGGFDCADDTIGPGTAGTANVWLDDVGRTENRPGLCD